MSMPHHGDDEQSRLMKLFREQQDRSAKRQWPEGRIEGSDDGQIAFKIESDPDTEIIKLDFGKQVTWLGMGPKDAIELAQLLIKHARAVSPQPIRINLH